MDCKETELKINGQTRMTAVIGNPIKHSLSPFIHNRAFEITDENGVYTVWEIGEEDLGQVMKNIKSLNMYGLNVSMPYKKAAMDHVDYLTDEAKLIGAVNTVTNFDGELIGHNTDGIGFFKALEFEGYSVENQEITVLGGGATAMAIIVQAMLLKGKQINVFARKSDSFEPLQEQLAHFEKENIHLYDLADVHELQGKINSSSLLVNATSSGMEKGQMPLSDKINLPSPIIVADIIYKNEKTDLLQWAENQGVSASNGLGMLLYQAAESFAMWTGKQMPVSQIEKELINEINH
jgi:shikimate dehydrogenase